MRIFCISNLNPLLLQSPAFISIHNLFILMYLRVKLGTHPL